MGAYFLDIYTGFKSLCAGLWVTLKHSWQPRLTIEYPEKKPRLPLRFRGRLAMPSDPATGKHRCTACMICVRACPNACIEVTKAAGPDGKPLPRAEKYVYHMETCLYCNICVEVCPFAAIIMSDEYESASFDKPALTLELVGESRPLKGRKLPWWLSKFKEEKA